MLYMPHLTDEEILEVRKQIVLNSLYLSDYITTFDLDPIEVEEYFEGYVEYLEELAEEAGDPNLDFRDFDTEENLLKWHNCIGWKREAVE